MKNELDKKLCEKYPLIFKNRHGDMRVTAMCWGFDVGDGWYNILDVLCSALYYDYRVAKDDFEYKVRIAQRSDYIENEERVNPDKYRVFATPIDVERARLAMVKAMEEVPIASQVKEKFGSLRFYVEGASREQYKLIAMAEHLSAKTCDICGKPATPNKERATWITTRCDDHKNA